MSKRPLPPPPGDKPVRTAPPAPPAWRHMLWLVVLVVALLYIVPAFVHTTSPTSLTYSQFLTDVAAGKVKNIDIPSPASAGANVTATGTLTDKKAYTTVIPGASQGSAVAGTLQKAGVSISYQPPGSSTGALVLQIVLFLVLPIALVFFVFRRMARTTGRSLQGVMGVGRSRAKVFDAEQPKTKFTDVAGYEGVKEEINEVVDFLRNPDRYQSAGALAPRGVLMVGPPGTGKTLIARAVAGEAGVPFFSVAGSSFVEMFVGVGAARVRDLFAEARKQAPAIIFVDEIDAIGQRRAGSGAVVSNDEREQTLNQLLSEMDGFDIDSGHRGARRHQPARGARSRLAAAGPVRPPGGDPAADAARAGRDPGRALPGQAARTGRRPHGRRPRHARLLRCRPGEPGERGGDLRRPGQPEHADRRRLRPGPGPDPARPPGGLECAAAGGEARGRRARGGPRARRGAVRARRSGRQGDDPARRAGARRDPAAAARRAAPVRRGLSHRVPGRPARRPGG